MTALKRVLAHKRAMNASTKKQYSTMEGIYLSKLQLKTLGENLVNMADGPDGLCFMIGVDKYDGKEFKTVEVIPYSKSTDKVKNKKIYKNGVFSINAGGLEEDSLRNLIFDANGQHKQPKPHIAAALVAADEEEITTPSQRTPPPFSE